MKNYIHTTVCALLFTGIGAMAQEVTTEDFVLRSRVYQDSIVLRWVPKDVTAWKNLNENGAIVTRTELATNTEKIVSNTILPYDLATWKTKTDTTNIFVATAAQCLLGKKSVTPNIAQQHFSNRLLAAKEQNNTLAFAAFSADFSTEAANGLAFRYVDRNIESGKSYKYVISVRSARSNTSYTRPSKIWKPVPVMGVQAKLGNNEVVLSWPKQPNNSHFSGYYVERATNNRNFERISKSIIKATKQTTDNPSQLFSDTAVEVGTNYQYRVVGITAFADAGLYSETVSATPQDKTPPPLVTDISVEATSETSFEIRWKLPEHLPTDVEGFRVLRSDNNDGPYQLISEGILPKTTTSFTDEQPQTGSSSFYIVIAEDKNGNFSETAPVMGVLPDDTPPQQPKGLTGAIDSLGIVSLAWDFGNEEDLRGYRVFRSDAKDQEFQQLTKSPVPGNFYADTLRLKTLKKNVYYKVAAFDNNYNPSAYSEVLMLKRPDFVAPVSPNIKELTFVNDSVNIIWKSSVSKDILEYQVWRKQAGSDWKNIGIVVAPKTTFSDGTVSANHSYSYKVLGIDGDGNLSEPSQILRIRTVPSKLYNPPVLTGQFYKEDKTFRLQWEIAEHTSLKKIVLLRNSGDGFLPYATFDASKTAFSDTQFFKNGRGYDYKIKTIDASGVSSAFSNIVKVQFK
ncbi:hypothetical protein [Marinirhabdus gelatinilytica]|uniref:Fibronectin type-III domain-containing protein n=1 Tax=Marinirhabdus gelatinilytica TaxID=1703343 RepID=A0A370QG53_9FLAO|nr:hypothetical protein [Marinirhabdus gelatinilytica]RDK87348.1 hypothetical protein C8D94_102535 [Marinirhabdus gelatinilytica]